MGVTATEPFQCERENWPYSDQDRLEQHAFVRRRSRTVSHRTSARGQIPGPRFRRTRVSRELRNAAEFRARPWVVRQRKATRNGADWTCPTESGFHNRRSPDQRVDPVLGHWGQRWLAQVFVHGSGGKKLSFFCVKRQIGKPQTPAISRSRSNPDELAFGFCLKPSVPSRGLLPGNCISQERPPSFALVSNHGSLHEKIHSKNAGRSLRNGIPANERNLLAGDGFSITI